MWYYIRSPLLSIMIIASLANYLSAHAQETAQAQLIPNMLRSGVVGDLDISSNGAITASLIEFNSSEKGLLTDTTALAIWSTNSRRLIRTIPLSSRANCIAFSRDGRNIWVGGDDAVKIFDIAGALLKQIKVARVNSISFSADGSVVLTSSDTGIDIWQYSSTKKLQSVVKGSYSSARFWRHDSEIVAIEQRKGASTLVNLDRNTGTRKLSIMLPVVGHRAIPAPKDDLIATRSLDAVRVWNGHSGKLVKTFPDTVGANMAFSPDGKLLITSDSQSIKAWDISSGLTIRSISREGELIYSIIFSPVNRSLIISAEAQGLRLRDVSDLREIGSFGSQAESRHIIGFEGTKAVVMTTPRGLRMWELSTGDFDAKYVSQSNDAPEGTLYYQGHLRLVDFTKKMELTLFDVATKEPVDTIPGHYQYFAVGDHGRSLVALEGRNIAVIDLTDKSRRLLELTQKNFLFETTLAHSPVDKKFVSYVSGQAELSLWDAGEGRLLWRHQVGGGCVGFVNILLFSRDGTRILFQCENTATIFEVSTGALTRIISLPSMVWASFQSNSNYVGVGTKDGKLQTWNISSGKMMRSFDVGAQPQIWSAFSDDGALAASEEEGGNVHLWDMKNGSQLAEAWAFDAGGWMIRNAKGDFDSNRLESISGVSWIMSDSPLSALAPEIFMRDYYEPRLLPRLLACRDAEAKGDADACNKAFRPKRPLAELNRIQPEVRIVAVQRGRSADEVLVDVEVGGKEDPTQKNGKTKTEVYDLRLFRDDQIVGQWPEPRGGMSGAEDIQAWRAEAKVPMADGQTKSEHRFAVHVARRDRGQSVRLTAYAFNEDRVKSETARDESYKVPDDVAPAKLRAYVITIGVNAYQNPNWKLGFAVKDARDLSAALQQIQGYDVVSVPLVSIEDNGSKLDQATKANIEAALALLAGKDGPYRDRLVKAIGSNAEKLQRASPDDLVILAFSGHGYTDQQARFYLLPSDSGTESTITDAVLPRFISSDELSQWLRGVDAGEMVMVIDACHSAATVPAGFKPGPMGDRGLGQLAYDKGMQILAATQADDVALESEKLGQGLLTYALVSDGIKARKAAAGGKGPITISSLLHYAERRVPELYADIQAGNLRVMGVDAKDADRKLVSKEPTVDPIFFVQLTKRAQTPALFDFYKQKYDPVLPVTQ
jgi:WD40 repeat protein/uncharacterized caspase-like protein